MLKYSFLALLLLLSFSCQNKIETPLNVPLGGDFSIPTTDGTFNTLAHRGKTIFLFFGFTQCPQVCPKTLSSLKQFSKLLPAAESKKIEILFVSVDLKRDSLETLRKRLLGFPANFRGAIDKEDNTRKILSQFGATSRVIQGKDPSDIIIDHTALIFMINQKGEWVESLKYDATAGEIFTAYKSIDHMTPTYSRQTQNRLIEVIGENRECDLAQTPCTIDGYEVSIGPYPITSSKEFKVKVTTAEGLKKPLEIDFNGIETNMGYIRPKLIKTADNSYAGDFYIPLCDLAEMQWKASLILETEQGPKSLLFYFKSVLVTP